MIRTRNFLLYVLSMVFLVSAIGYTVANDTVGMSYSVPETVAFVENQATAYGAIAGMEEEDRDAYIEAMRQKIAQGLGKIDGAPVVFTSVDDTPEPGMQVAGSATVAWCDVPERTDDVTASWFQGPVTLEDTGVARRAVQTLPSGADSDTPTRTLIELSKATARNAYDTCLSHDIIGIGVDGTLIINYDTWRFGGYGDGVIVGYALDGFPIITGGEGGMLDSCGGTDMGDGYAYRVRTDSESILSCFAGTPAQFAR